MKAYLFRPTGMGKKSCEGIKELSTTGITVVESQRDQHPNEPHLCIRWGCVGHVPQGRNVLNKLPAMHNTVDKGRFRIKLFKAGLSMATWDAKDDAAGLVHNMPCVVRPGFHAKGKDFYLCKNAEEYAEAIRKCGPDWYASRYIDKLSEFRINVLQNRILCIIEKSAKDKNDVVWGRGNTVILNWSEWPIGACKVAIKAMQLSGLDFAGVDVIEDKKGNFYVLEVNTMPFLEGPYQRQCFTKGFDWVVNNGREHFNTDKMPDWKSVIHPAISDKARV